MSGPKPTQIELTNRQRIELEKIVRKASSQQAHVKRAKIILKAAEGHNNQQIADQLEIHRETAREWRNRWAEKAEGLKAAEEDMEDKEFGELVLELLSDQPRSGAPCEFTAEQICRIVELACEKPKQYGRPVTEWTPRELADEAIKQEIVTSISARSVGRFLKRCQSETPSITLLAEQ